MPTSSARLDQAIDVLTPLAGSNAYGSYDLIYQGDVSHWIKFANSLRLRLALRVSKVQEPVAVGQAEAEKSSCRWRYLDYTSAGTAPDDAFIERSSVGGDINGLSTMSDWNEFRMSATMASVLKGYQDPRINQYFLPTVNSKNPHLRQVRVPRQALALSPTTMGREYSDGLAVAQQTLYASTSAAANPPGTTLGLY